MHASSMENMRTCIDRYLDRGPLSTAREISVLDVGGADVNGSYRVLFPPERFRYLGADIDSDASVDVRMEDPERIPLDDESVDVVISGQVLEHCDFFWVLFAEMVRVMKREGFLFLIVPSAGPIHRYPVDCYRFHPDALAALARFTGCTLVDWWDDHRSQWHDVVGVFRHADATPVPAAPRSERVPSPGPAGGHPTDQRAPSRQPDGELARARRQVDALRAQLGLATRRENQAISRLETMAGRLGRTEHDVAALRHRADALTNERDRLERAYARLARRRSVRLALAASRPFAPALRAVRAVKQRRQRPDA